VPSTFLKCSLTRVSWEWERWKTTFVFEFHALINSAHSPKNINHGKVLAGVIVKLIKKTIDQL
jgi:hypothetical protein